MTKDANSVHYLRVANGVTRKRVARDICQLALDTNIRPPHALLVRVSLNSTRSNPDSAGVRQRTLGHGQIAPRPHAPVKRPASFPPDRAGPGPVTTAAGSMAQAGPALPKADRAEPRAAVRDDGDGGERGDGMAATQPRENSGRSRNGTLAKGGLTDIGPVGTAAPRDRGGRFEPRTAMRGQPPCRPHESRPP